MGTTPIPGGVLFYGPPVNLVGGAPGAVGTVGFALANVNNAVALMFQCPSTGTIERVAFEQGVGSAGTNTKRVSLQDIALATGFPDGTADQFRTGDGTTADAWITTGILSSDGTDTGTQRAVTQGDWLAVVFDYTAFTSGSWIIEGIATVPDELIPYQATRNNVGTWAYDTTTIPSVAVKYATGWVAVGPHAIPARTLTTSNVSNATTPDEIALRFIPDRTLTVCGLYAYIALAGDYTAILYNSSGTILASGTIDKDFRRTTTAFWAPIMFTADVDLTSGATYRLAMQASDANTSTLYAYNVADATTMGVLFGGAEWYASQRTDAGAWTDTTTRRYFLYPMVRGFL